MKSESQTVAHMVCCDHVRFASKPRGGGGGALSIYTGGGQKGGVLGTGTTQKGGS